MTGGEKLGRSEIASRGIAKTPSKMIADAIMATVTRRFTAKRAIGLTGLGISGMLGKIGILRAGPFQNSTVILRLRPEKGLSTQDSLRESIICPCLGWPPVVRLQSFRDPDGPLPAARRVKVGLGAWHLVRSVEQMKVDYEVTYILRPGLEEAEVTERSSAIADGLKGNGGDVSNVELLGKKRLAYEIDDLREGIYVVMTFKAEAPAAKELERQLRLNEDVMRALVIKLDKHALAAAAAPPQPPAPAPAHA